MTSKNTTVESYMNTWLKQMNYPEVAVSFTRNNSKTIVNFRQARFLLTEFDDEETPFYESPYK